MAIVRLPGLIDPHVHLRDPGATHKEDFTSGTRAALKGGFTCVLDMPNNPGAPVLSPAALHDKVDAARGRLACDLGFYYGASVENARTFDRVSGRVFGLKLYLDHTTGDLKVDSLEAIRDIMRAWPAEWPLLVHAEDRTLAMVLGLVPHVRRSVHFCHISEKIEIELIRDAKERGLPVTCEVAPHHLFLSEDDLPGLGALGAMKPPLRRGADVDALWSNLDAIDMIATDHAPHTLEEKRGATPPFGVPGLETALPLMLTAVTGGRLTLDRLVEMMHGSPSRVFRVPAQPDTFTEVDTSPRWRIGSAALETKCGWTPFDGLEAVGRVSRVQLRSEVVVERGDVVNGALRGRVLVPMA